MAKRNRRKPSRILGYSLCLLLLFLGSLCFYSGRWYVNIYGLLGFDSILYTLTNELGGVQSGIVLSYCLRAIPPALIITGLAAVFLFPFRRNLVLYVGSSFRMNLLPFRNSVALLLSVCISLSFTYRAAVETEFVEMLQNGGKYSEPSLLYETWYADPEETDIIFPEEKRNLIYIYLESMETTFYGSGKWWCAGIQYHSGADPAGPGEPELLPPAGCGWFLLSLRYYLDRRSHGGPDCGYSSKDTSRSREKRLWAEWYISSRRV